MRKNALKLLLPIAKAEGWSVISEVGVINNQPVYELRRPNAHGKIGYPHLYMINGSTVQELNIDQIRVVIKQPSFQNGGERLQ